MIYIIKQIISAPMTILPTLGKSDVWLSNILLQEYAKKTTLILTTFVQLFKFWWLLEDSSIPMLKPPKKLQRSGPY